MSHVERDFLTLSVTIPRDENESQSLLSFLGARNRIQGWIPKKNPVNSRRIISYSTGALSTYRKAKHRGPRLVLAKCFYVPIRIWVSGTTPVDKTLCNNIR